MIKPADSDEEKGHANGEKSICDAIRAGDDLGQNDTKEKDRRTDEFGDPKGTKDVSADGRHSLVTYEDDHKNNTHSVGSSADTKQGCPERTQEPESTNEIFANELYSENFR